MKRQRRHAGGTILDTLSPRGKTRREAAALLGVSYDTIVRWHHNGELVPDGPHDQRGGVTIFKYSDEQLERKKRSREDNQ